MTTLTVTAKGQVTLRKNVLRHLGVSPGQQIEVVLLPEGRVVGEGIGRCKCVGSLRCSRRQGRRRDAQRARVRR